MLLGHRPAIPWLIAKTFNIATQSAVLFVFSCLFASLARAQSDRLADLESAVAIFGHLTYYKDAGDVGLTVTANPDRLANTPAKSSLEAVSIVAIYVKPDDTGAATLAESFPNIKILDLQKGCWNSQLAVKGPRLRKLEHLWADECDLSAEDMKYIGKMTKLNLLHLVDSKDAGEGLDALSELTQLKQLCLAGVKIPSANKLKWLANNKDLRALWLDRTGIDDEIVPILKQLPKLAHLSLEDTKVSKKACEELSAMPSLKLFIENSESDCR